MAFIEEQFYHVYNRGIENKIIFPSEKDYLRFYKGLNLFNSSIPVEFRRQFQSAEVRPPRKLVHIVSYCLMKDHVHLLIKIITPEGTTQFLRKLFGGYTMYFNTKYKRKGVLFQSRSKSKHINDNLYLDQILRYINLNPLDYFDINWRKHKVKNIKKAKSFIFNYPWSSIKGIIEEKEDFILSKEIIKEFIPSKRDFLNSLLSWSSEKFDVYSEF